MTHPAKTDLALFAGGDLGLIERWRLRRHVSSCRACSLEADAFRAASAELRAQPPELPARLNWDRLAAEMVANIHVGIEAAECIPPVRRTARSSGWRAAAVMAAMSAAVVCAWLLNPEPRRPDRAMTAPRIEMRNTSTGLELNENGNALVLLHGRGREAHRPIITSAPGTLRARYVDDSGQMTINNVYAE